MTITMLHDVDLSTVEVCVYKNLTNGRWSITAVKGNDNRGQLLAYADQAMLVGARAVVKESRRLHIASGGHREVCAWFVGKLVDLPAVVGTAHRVTFRPRVGSSFVLVDDTPTGTPMWDADCILFDRGGNAYIAY